MLAIINRPSVSLRMFSVARTVNQTEHAVKRDSILDAARQLVLDKGYENFTVQDLLDVLGISKGAFYHYFASKPAVIEALTERLVDESERLLSPIVERADLSALEKLQCFFAETIRWKSAQQSLMLALLPVWYAEDNAGFRQKVNRAVARRLAPLLTAIVREGVNENSFTTAYPAQAGAIIIAIIQALQDALAEQLLAARAPAQPARVNAAVAIYGAHVEAIERLLAIPSGALYRADATTVEEWIDAQHLRSFTRLGRTATDED